MAIVFPQVNYGPLVEMVAQSTPQARAARDAALRHAQLVNAKAQAELDSIKEQEKARKVLSTMVSALGPEGAYQYFLKTGNLTAAEGVLGTLSADRKYRSDVQAYNQNEQMFPEELRGKRLANNKVDQEISYNSQINPLNIEGKRVQNARDQQALDQARQTQGFAVEQMRLENDLKRKQLAKEDDGVNQTPKNILLPNGNIVAANYDPRSGKIFYQNEFGQVVEAPPGSSFVSQQIAGKNVSDLTTPVRTGLQQTVMKNQKALATLDEIISEIQQNPNSVGIAGTLIENVGGVAQQVPGIGKYISDALGSKKVKGTRTKLRALVGQVVQEITGDTSGRYSDRDVQLAQQVISGLDAWTGPEDALAALGVLREIVSRGWRVAEQRLNGNSAPTKPRRFVYQNGTLVEKTGEE